MFACHFCWYFGPRHCQSQGVMTFFSLKIIQCNDDDYEDVRNMNDDLNVVLMKKWFACGFEVKSWDRSEHCRTSFAGDRCSLSENPSLSVNSDMINLKSVWAQNLTNTSVVFSSSQSTLAVTLLLPSLPCCCFPQTRFLFLSYPLGQLYCPLAQMELGQSRDANQLFKGTRPTTISRVLSAIQCILFFWTFRTA